MFDPAAYARRISQKSLLMPMNNDPSGKSRLDSMWQFCVRNCLALEGDLQNDADGEMVQ